MTINTRRVLALVIDLLIIGVIISLFSNIFEIKGPKKNIELYNIDFIYGYSYVFLFYLSYFFLFDFINKSITLGKALFKIKLMFDANDKTLFRRILRSIIKVISLIIFPISILLFLVKKKALQDYLFKLNHIKY
jgi:uncharacterized RDD family membrane protein YckC